MNSKETLNGEVTAPFVLRHLLHGGEVHKDGEIYVLSEDYELCVRRKLLGDESEVLLKVNFGDFSLPDFIKFCSSLTAEEYNSIALSSAFSMCR